MTNPTSIGSNVPGIQMSLTQISLTNAKHGSLPKSIWMMAASWFSIRLDKRR